MYIGLRPMVSDNGPQKSGEIPWMTRYDVMVNDTSARLTRRSWKPC